MAEIEKARLTPASAWRKDYVEGVEFTMPHNGRVIALRALDEQYLLVTGKIPDSFSRLALAAAKAVEENAEDAFNRQLQSMTELDIVRAEEEYKRGKIIAALAHPRVVDKAIEEDEIEYEWLGKKDKDFILERLAEPAEEWGRFPAKPNASLESLPVVEISEEDTEQIGELVETH